MEVFVNSYTEGVSFILGCLQVLISFFRHSFPVRVCVCVRSRVCACARVRCGPHGCISMYKQELESGSVAWVLMNAFFACGFKKCWCTFLFLRPTDRSRPLPSSLPSPPSLSPLSPVVFADPNVFGTTLKFLLKKTQKKTLKITKKKKSPAWKYLLKRKKYVSKKKNP